MSPDTGLAEIRRRFPASPDRLFSAFADPGKVSRWLRPSPEVTLRVLRYDFRVGGAYRFAYHVPDGQIMHVNGTYSAIEPASRIVFTWNIEPPDEHAGLESEVTVAISPAGEGCELHIRHALLTLPGSRDRHDAGWAGALNGLAELLAADPSP